MRVCVGPLFSVCVCVYFSKCVYSCLCYVHAFVVFTKMCMYFFRLGSGHEVSLVIKDHYQFTKCHRKPLIAVNILKG